MPKFTVVATMSGSRDGVDWPRPGEVVDLPQVEGEDYARAGFVAPLDKVETATARPVETATRPRGSRKPHA